MQSEVLDCFDIDSIKIRTKLPSRDKKVPKGNNLTAGLMITDKLTGIFFLRDIIHRCMYAESYSPILLNMQDAKNLYSSRVAQVNRCLVTVTTGIKNIQH